MMADQKVVQMVGEWELRSVGRKVEWKVASTAVWLVVPLAAYWAEW